MKCKKCKTEIPDVEIAHYLASKGGSAGTGKAKARDPEKMREAQKKSVIARMEKKEKKQARAAAVARWAKEKKKGSK